MRSTARWACLVGLVLAGCKDENAAENPFLAPGEAIQGMACEDLIADWGQWAVHRARENPEYCVPGPTDDLWLAAGEPGAGTHAYACTVPSGVTLFVPMFFGFVFSCPEVGGPEECQFATDAGLLAYIESFEAETVTQEVALDGVAPEAPANDYLCRGVPFDLDHDPANPSRLWFPQDYAGPGLPPADFDCTTPWEETNACDAPAGPRRVQMSGYFYAVGPLAPGQHILHLTGCMGAENPQCLDNTWTITVEAP